MDNNTFCPRSCDPFYIVTYNIKGSRLLGHIELYYNLGKQNLRKKSSISKLARTSTLAKCLVAHLRSLIFPNCGKSVYDLCSQLLMWGNVCLNSIIIRVIKKIFCRKKLCGPPSIFPCLAIFCNNLKTFIIKKYSKTLKSHS